MPIVVRSGDSLKACTACHMVKYCNRDCQISHRPQHKKECKKRVAELYDEKLFKEPPPPEECPICMSPMPYEMGENVFYSCCGKNICGGCVLAMMISKRKSGDSLCPYCRVSTLISDEEQIKGLERLTNANNSFAFFQLGGYYDQGVFGLTQDYQKAHELNLRAGELGCANGYFNLGTAYDEGRGVAIDKKKSKHYYGLAAMGGHAVARHILGCMEGEAGNEHRAIKHCILAARAGYKDSLDTVKRLFMRGAVTKDE